MLHVVLWKWVQPDFRCIYTAEHVNIVARKLALNLPGVALRVLCVTDDPTGIEPPVVTYPLWPDHNTIRNATGVHLPSCYRRLKLFDRKTQEALGIELGDRIVSLDLDTIILRPFVDVLDRIHKSKAIFAGWGVRGHHHKTVFNGSFWTFSAGEHLQEMWSGFDPATSPKLCLKKGFLGSDQAWLSMNFVERNDVMAVRFPDFVSYPREVRRTHNLDRRAKIIFFHGSRKPWHIEESRHQPWIQNEWR